MFVSVSTWWIRMWWRVKVVSEAVKGVKIVWIPEVKRNKRIRGAVSYSAGRLFVLLPICVALYRSQIFLLPQLFPKTISTEAETLFNDVRNQSQIPDPASPFVPDSSVNRLVYFSPLSTLFTLFSRFYHWAEPQLEVLPKNISRNNRRQQTWVNFHTERLQFKAVLQYAWLPNKCFVPRLAQTATDGNGLGHFQVKFKSCNICSHANTVSTLPGLLSGCLKVCMI